jgi:uncharacterized protein YifN (PemK superfamily)
LSTEDPAGVHTNYHAKMKHELMNKNQNYNNDISEVIQEVSEVDEQEKSRLIA